MPTTQEQIAAAFAAWEESLVTLRKAQEELADERKVARDSAAVDLLVDRVRTLTEESDRLLSSASGLLRKRDLK
jgi:hypothetical protein